MLPRRTMGIATATVPLILLLASPAPAAAIEIQPIADAASVHSYRMKASMSFGEDPPMQLAEVDGAYTKEPPAEELQTRVSEGGRKPWVRDVRRVGGVLYAGSGGKWGEIERFDLTEMSIVLPEDLLGMGEGLEVIAEEEWNGRAVLHLRGDKDDLPDVKGSSDGIEFSRTDRATVDLWVDEEEHFIVKFQILAEVSERGETLPIEFTFEVSDINDAITVEPPSPESMIRVEVPPMPTAEEVAAKLGFEFALPEGARVSIVAATVNVLTAMPLPEARDHAARSMGAAGFTLVEESESYPGEFHAVYRRGERTLGVKVFQVSETGATIQVNAPK